MWATDHGRRVIDFTTHPNMWCHYWGLRWHSCHPYPNMLRRVCERASSSLRKKISPFERVGTHRPPANRDTWPQEPRLGSWAMGAQTARAHSPHVLWRETLNFTSKLSCSPQEISALAVTARLQLRRRTTIAADGWWSVGLVVRKVG